MEFNKENLLEMLKEYTKERPISFGQVMMYWADFIDWLDTRGLTLHEAVTEHSGAIFSPDYAGTAICDICGVKITWNGDRWMHDNVNPRHGGVPRRGSYRNPAPL